MKRSIFLGFAVFSILFACIGCKNSPTGAEHGSDLEFSKMEIHYARYGGWINTSILDIQGDSRVNACEIAHASYDTLNSSYIFVDEEEQNKLENLFESFSAYDSYYTPEEFLTDQDFHIIVLTYEGNADTVTVYMPEQSDMPDKLGEIIHEMKTLWVICSSLFE